MQAAYHAPSLLVVDEREREVVALLPTWRAIVIGDDSPRDSAGLETRLRLLARPFSADGLLAVVRYLLG